MTASSPDAGVEEAYSLTPLQQGMLVDALRAPRSGVNVEQVVVRLGAPADAARMERAWERVVERHPVLRTRFRWDGAGEPVQEVLAGARVEISRHDGGALEGWLEDDRARGFDPVEGPPMRLALFAGGEGGDVLVWSFHHILLDGASVAHVLDEVFALHDADGGEPALPARRPFRDHVEWLRGRDAAADEAFWAAHLRGAGVPERLAGHRDAPRDPAAEPATGEVEARLSEDATAALRAFEREEGVWLSTLAQGAWALLLGRWTGSGEAVFGVVRGGRGTGVEGAEGMVGLLINTVPLRVPLPAGARVIDWLDDLGERTAALAAHEHAALPDIARWSGLPAGVPLFDTFVDFQPRPFEASFRATGPGGEARSVRVLRRTGFPLSLAVTGETPLRVRVEYDAERFDASAARRILADYTRLLGEIAAGPARRLGELWAVGTDAEAAGEAAPAPRADGCVHHRFEGWAARRPEGVAAVHEGVEITYAELDARANRLANLLRRHGVGTETRVGVCLERSPDLLATLLAVLKAGGAYLPLDPETPAERTAFVLRDAGAALVVTTGALAGRLPAEGVPLLRLDALAGALAEESARAPEVPALPESAAYVLYTSGSTGTPKGVVVPHGAASAHLETMIEACGYGPGERGLAFTAITFDPSLEQILSALSAGSSLAFRGAEVWTPGELADAVERFGVTILNPPTAYWHALAADEAALARVRARVKLVLTGGETMRPASVAAWHRGGPAPVLLNGYGPTETVVTATVRRTEPADGAAERVPVGTALPGRRAYVLDAAMRPVPHGVPGELYLAGAAMARGYQGRPAATAERFVPDPFGAVPGARLYRTGDRARRVAGGGVDFLGRLDDQVKVRGFRIEPGEVEAVLRAHPEVRDCAVVARDDGRGETRLVAYTVGGAEADALRAHLARSLPPYMVPAAFVALDRMPMSPNGKVDRRALPAPVFAGEGYVAPRTPAEEVLAAIWAEVLGVERVGVHDTFAELGGHSLLATRVVSRVREAFGAEVPLRALFDAPTVAGLAEHVEALRRAGAPPAPPVLPAPRDRPLPLSFAQERLWFLDRLQPGSVTYNLPTALRLRGALDAGALERALAEIVRRHEALRTTFPEAGGGPVQGVAPFAGFALPVDDLSAAADPAAEAARRASAEAARPFDLAAGPLFRAALLRLGADDHVLLLCLHHIVTDGWSRDLLFDELAALYEAFREGRPSPLPDLPLGYPDFAAWQRERMRGETLERELAYWRGRLAGAPALLELPTDRPRPAAQRYRGARARFSLPAELAGRLEALARSEDATPYMVLLATFQLLLARYARVSDVVVGSSSAGRSRREAEGVIGFFANTLVVRTDLSGDPSFRALLRRVRESTLGAYEHQEVPFERLLDDLQPERSLGYNPVFQAFFALLTDGAPRLAGVEVEALPVEVRTAKFDLSLFFTRGEGGLEGTLEYATDLFDAATAARTITHLSTLLESVAADPGAPVSTLRMVAGAERETLLGWSGARERLPVSGALHERFERQAAARPGVVAVVSGGASLTYGELNARANRLARRLRAHGVGPESRVGLCAERSADLVAGVLAVLKAGGAYVPLDPAYPAERLAYMAEDSDIRVLLAPSALRGRVAPGGAAFVPLDEVPADEIGDDLGVESDPGRLAYVIYTSGSTGRPKGVGVTHANVLRLFDATRDAFAFGEADAWTLFHSYAFDFSVWELWGALLHGGRLVVVPFDVSRDPAAFRALLKREGVTVLNQTPSAFRALAAADEAEPAPLDRLRLVVFGGEALAYESLRGWLDRYGPKRPRLVNMYGITETTVHVTWHTVTGAELQQAGAGSGVGVPLPDLGAYVLDPGGSPAPTGVPGELHVGGAGVARGYLGRPALTAERFVPDPFSGEPGARLYRSGDLARWTAGGTLEYLGRIDQQVKVRGFRIEPGEIESALLAHPGVAAATVAVRGEGEEAALVAYVVAAGEGAAPAALREALKARLPEHMVPAAFVALDRIPLTANGKVDRAALPAPEEAGDALAREAYVAPRTPVEEVLAGLWTKVLGVERVGVHDDFFALGGHSLLATRVVSWVRDVMGVEVGLRALFEGPTVAELAAEVEAARRGAAPPAPAPRGPEPEPEPAPVAASGTSLPPVTRAPRDRPLPLSFGQERLWLLDRMHPGSAAYNHPAALRLTGALDAGALERALDEIVRRHEALRTVFREVDGAPAQVVAPPGSFRLAMEDLSALEPEAREAEAARRLAGEAARPFDLAAGPLFGARLLRLSGEEHLLVLSMHHAVADGWSMGVLFRELAALYAAIREGRDPGLAPLPVQYADYAVWQRERLDGRLEGQVEYWRRRLAGAPALLELPADHPRPAVPGERGGRVAAAFPGPLAGALKALGRSEGATLYMVLLGAVQLLLGKYAATEDVVVGSPVAGRTRGETEGLIGFFVNTLVLRADLSGDPTFRELLGRVRETTLGAYEHQDVPFERLVAELRPGRSTAHSPFFQVMVSLDEAAPPRALAGVRAESVEVGLAGAKFDLGVAFVEEGGGLRAVLAYDAGLFERSTVERMAEHLGRLLERVAAAPEARLSALELLGDAERARVVTGWNDTARAYDRAPVHLLFSAHARRTPDAVALLHGGEAVTYAALDARAEAVARRLRALGIGPEAPVGLCVERTPDLLAGVLGIWKAGGAYVPLDPGYPAERLAWIVEDAALPVIVTAGGAAAALPANDAAVVRIDAVDASASAVSSGAIETAVSPSSLAYVIYTSGSTGRPKGVLVEHGSLANLLASTREAFGIGTGDVMPALASYAFDIWLFEALLPLTSGAAVRLVARERVLDVPALVAETADATFLHAVPALMREIAVAEAARPRMRRLRRAFVGGDRVPPDLLAEMRAALPSAAAHILYGPTETAILASAHPVPDDGAVAGHPIGRPLGNVRLYVCDAAGRALPQGLVGELLIGGAGVARGYFGRPGLTAEKFVPDPFGEPGARLYRTGDRARWRGDGTLEYRGRTDHQVKVRGYRIEPGEVEAALRRHPGVRECVVAPRGDAGETRLVAYVAGAADAEGLRAHLRRILPEHMVPSAFVVLEALPVTPNGKLDRDALPAPEDAPGEAHRAPRTPAEELMAGIWAEVLRRDRVGVDDDFFALGGHSLLATRVVSRVRDVFGAELPLRAVFEAPTVAALAERVAAAGAGEAARLPAVVPVSRAEPLPLSFGQERLWFLDRLEPGSPLYNVPAALRLEGPLDAGALERALAEVVRRHEALRTVFAERDGAPVQVVAPFAGFTLAVEELSGLDEPAREAEARRRADADAARPFDLAAGPLFRATLLRLAPEAHVLLLCVHHAASDGWSMGVLFRELSALYAAFAEGRESPLAGLPVQYADYAAWQRRHLRGEALERGLAYWSARLAGAPALLELPTDHPRPAVQSYRGAYARTELPAALVERLRALGRSEGATLYMVVLGAFQLLLARYAATDDVVVGSPIAGRTRREVEELVGFFVNTLAVRTRLDGDPSFREVLRRVREATLGAYAHQEVPFERLVEALQPERGLDRSPLFQVMLALEDGDRAAPAFPGVRAAPVSAGFHTAKFDLSLFLSASGGGLAGGIVYSTDLFEPATVERMLEQLARVLERVEADPDARISELELLGADERRRVLEEWGRTEGPVPAWTLVHRAIAARAAETPESVAIRFGSDEVSYAELEARSNRLARRLRGLGVGPEVRVGLFLERGPELVAAVLGVLKAGGAYVPLDPSYPSERLSYMASDSGMTVVLTQDRLRPALPAPDGVPVVSLDDASDESTVDASPPESGADARSLAYVLYTSGSTGRPKGVAIEHGALAAYLSWATRAYPGRESVLHSSLSFDLTVTSLFVPLLSGGCVELVEETDAVEALARRLERPAPYGLLKLTPTHLRALGELLEGRNVGGGAECMVVGGEALLGETLEGWRRRFPNTVLVNEYGPTETVVGCSIDARPLADIGPGRVPIGRPVPGTRLYVLDAAGHPTPAGVPGEVFVGGAQVGRGYLGRPGLTAERFVPDPFGGEPGARLYRTGDRARWSADGVLDYLGRVDEQVKVRGFRVEPGEIEAALRSHPDVADCTVVAREDVPGDRRLVAYVVGGADAEALRAHLRRSLPEHMVPSAFVSLDAIPVTPNGKVDRAALPAPEVSAHGGTAPRTPVEEVLAGIWAEVLGVGAVGVEESFFELGGHSLLAMRVASRVREVFSVELPLRALFEGPTVAELAGRVESLRRAGAPILPPVVPVDRTRPLPLSFAQERLWFLDRLQPGGVFYNIPVPLRLTGALDVAALEWSLGEVVRRHESLRTTLHEVDGAAVQRIAPFAGFTLPVETLPALDETEREAEVRRLVADETGRPFDLEAGPLFRARLARLGEDDHLLLLGMHHVVSDAWSMGILFRELAALYAARVEGRPSPLPELAVQYADHAAWEREHRGGGALDREVEYWRERLAGAPELLPLPTDHPRPAVMGFGGAQVPVRLPRPALDRLEALGRQEGATLYMVLLAAFQLLLARYCDSDDVVVGTTVAGRTRRETEPLVGLFMNTLVLRTDLSGDPGFRALLRRVREVTLGAYEHQEVPFERLVTALRPERDLSHSPLFQVLFELHEGDAARPALAGVEVRPAAWEASSAKVDLSVALRPTPEGLAGSLVYRTDLFEPATAARMAAHLARVLEHVAADPGARRSEVALMDAAERRRVVEEWNRTAAPFPAGRCIHHLFEAQADRTPGAPAVVHASGTLTYAGLEAGANRLARHLRGLGVGPETRVGLCLERGPELMTAILGVMKAGAAYVPVDPSHPAERTGYVLADSGAAVVLTQARLRDAHPAPAGARVLCLDEEAGRIAAESGARPESGATPENLAYVIYTSGSTGRPKGVAMHHRGVCNYIDWGIRAYGAAEGNGAPVFSSMAVDLTVTNLLPLFAGKPVHLLPEENAVEALADVLRERPGFGLIKITPIHLALLTPMLSPEEARAAAGTLVIGADFLAAEPTVFWQEQAPEVRLMNEYGPTETVVGCSAYTLPNGVHRAGAVPVGGPIQNLTFHVLDAHMQPVPVGLPGELYIGGVGVARGYLGRPGLSAEKFVPDPFAGGGARMYRSGDRARWLEGGDLVILGRTDHQVKIRGYRVEPGEIEAALRRHEGVTGCLVVAREDVPGEKRLVAYVAGTADPRELRERLRGSLPEHMVPSAFVVLDRMPSTATGKVDPRTLPAPELVRDDDAGRVAPRTRIEEVLAEVWAEVLHLDDIGMDEGFFELGGDSILSIQVVARARRAGVRITPRQIFEYQTIAALASVAVAEGAEAPAPEERVAGAARATPIQAWFFERGHARPGHYNQSVLLSVDPSVREEALEAALAAVVEQHDALRLRFRRAGEGWEAWHADAAGVALERADLSALPAAERDRAQEAVADRAQAGMELERGPLARAVLLDRGEEGRVLLLAAHHLAVDGVSWRILREDLERACARVEAGEPAGLGPRGTSYQEWARVLEAWAAGGEPAREAELWLAQGPEGVRPLPADGEGGGTVAGERAVTVRFGEEETRALLQEVPAAYRTQINDVLLCALAETVGRWTGSPRVRFALEGHGREEVGGADLTRTVGWFTTLYPVVLDLAGAAGPGERLKRVKEQLRAVPGKGIGYGALRYLAPDAALRAALAAHPEPEIVFNYLGQFDQGLSVARRFRFAAGPRGRETAPENRRPHALAVNGDIREGRLRLSWTYSEGAFRRETVERLAEGYLEALRALVAHCREAGAGGYTPSDFPLAALGAAEVDALLAGRRGVEDVYPLSPMQEGMLFHAVSGDGAQEYQVQIALRLEGRLDEALFRRAWDEVVARHAVLRTAFVWRGLERPLQRVERAVELPWTVDDWSGLGEAEREAALERYLAEDRARGFVVEEAPLMRCALFRAGPGAWWLVWSLHHLLTDGWATSRVLGEVLALHRAWSTGEPVTLGRVRPYRDYIAWLERQDPEAAERYWRGVLAGFTAPTPLASDHPAPAGGGARYAAARAVVPAGLARRLDEGARRMQVTLNTLLQGAWAVLLSRHAGEEEVVFGATVSGRPAELEGVEEMVGLFINTLPVRLRARPEARVDAWLREAQRAQAEAREYEYAPLARVQGWSEVPRGTPLFESLFVFENYPVERRAGDGAPLRIAGVRALDWTTYPLTLVVAPGRELALQVSYDEDRFERATAERMLEQLTRLLERMEAGPGARIADLELLGADERRRVLDEWGRTEAPVPAWTLVHRAIAARAAEMPESVAVRFGSAEVSYAELDARSNRLARRLRGLGVGPEVRVGLFLERGPELVSAVLGVLKAGGAYVPLDPSYPSERLSYMASDSGMTVVLTQDRLRPALPAPDGVPVVSLDDSSDDSAVEASPLESGADARSLAYVLYTSGSTGRPKGVAIEHGALAAYLSWATRAYPGRESVLHSSLSFDLTVTSLFVPLLSGGCVELVEETDAVEALARRLERPAPYGLLKLTPTHLRALGELLEGRDAGGGAECMVVGGEALLGETLEGLARRFPGTVLVNEYGPTETVVGCSIDARPLAAVEPGRVPIGRPVPGTRLYVLDAAGHPTPAGVPGEVFVGGAQVGRGYLGRPGLTAERFVPDPFGGEPGARLYRTGDRARWSADGVLDYLGRLDEQVKVRGFRVEPGEIEAALRGHPGVVDCTVVAREDVAGDRRLVAYVVGEVDAEALRAHLRRSLPEHMVPSAFVALDAIPATPNGKVDRAALPAPESSVAEDRRVAPRTPLEEVLAGIWAEVLGVDAVGVDESFFELGGHSLLAMRVVSRVRALLEVELPMRVLFEGPTVSEVAARVEALRRAGAPVLPPVLPVDRTLPLPLSFAQERLWFLHRMDPAGALYNVMVARRLTGGLDVAALEWSLGEVVRRHESLRTTIHEVDGAAVQRVTPFAGFALSVEALPALGAAEREEEARRRVAEEGERPFDLAAGPLFRARLLRLAEDDHLLVLAMHHLVSDAWSTGVLFREVAALYAAFLEGRPSPLPPLPVQYADFAAWQREHLRGEALERQVAYWRVRLSGAPALLELPTDRPRPAVQTYRGAAERITLPAELLEGLRALGRREGATLFMVLLGAFQLLLSKYAGSDDIVVGSPIAGRTRGETEGLIGFFVNTLVLRTRLEGDPTVREALGRVREATLGAYEHQEVPFERLVEALRPERSLSHSPLFQVMFSVDEPGGAAAALPGVRIGGVDSETESSKFDLSVGFAVDARGGFHAHLEYATDLFDGETVVRMAERLRRVLEQVAARPDARLSEIELADEAERRLVVEGWNRTAAELPAEGVHRRVEARAAEAPEAVALVHDGRTLTYRELDERANRIAHHLAGLGVGPETRVGLCLERGPEMVAAMLGVLKAGGAYLPLDPAYPAGRLAFMLADAGAAVLVTQERLRAAAAPPAGVRVVSVDGADAGEIARRSPLRPEREVSPEALAYVIYTSGSTGTPKGVGIEHRALANYVVHAAREYGLGPGDRVLQFHSFSFDPAAEEVFATLLSGAALVLRAGEALEPRAFWDGCRRDGVTVLDLPTAVLHTLVPHLEAEPAALPATLRLAVTGGERLLPGALRAWRRVAGGARLLNSYGPTETTVGATLWDAAGAEGQGAEGVPIGAPVPNTRVYVADAALRPAPVGVPGELLVGGVQVARGYVGRPAATAERFVPDPFAAEPGARLYRTGDRARWRPGGVLEYLGRADGQVKVRGFRLEPGEVEAALRTHPAVRECAVAAREHAPGDHRLVAYVVGEAPAEALREHLRGRLPEYMVPGVFVALDALPLTPNGKVDHRALPAPAAAEGARAPATGLEARIAAVWRDLLGLPSVGVDDNFFDLGGHSLLLVRLQARLATDLGRELPVVELFQYPTVRALAGRLEGRAEDDAVEAGEHRGAARHAARGRRLEARGRRGR